MIRRPSAESCARVRAKTALLCRKAFVSKKIDGLLGYEAVLDTFRRGGVHSRDCRDRSTPALRRNFEGAVRRAG